MQLMAASGLTVSTLCCDTPTLHWLIRPIQRDTEFLNQLVQASLLQLRLLPPGLQSVPLGKWPFTGHPRGGHNGSSEPCRCCEGARWKGCLLWDAWTCIPLPSLGEGGREVHLHLSLGAQMPRLIRSVLVRYPHASTLTLALFPGPAQLFITCSIVEKPWVERSVTLSLRYHWTAATRSAVAPGWWI